MNVLNTQLICFLAITTILVGPVSSEKTDFGLVYQYAPYIILLTVLLLLLVIALVAMMCTEPRNAAIGRRTSLVRSGHHTLDEERGSLSQQLSVGSSYRQHSVRSHGDARVPSFREHRACPNVNGSPPYSGSYENETVREHYHRSIFDGCCPWNRNRSARQSLETIPSLDTLNDEYEYVVEKLLIRKVPLSLAAIHEDLEEKYAEHSVKDGYSDETVSKGTRTPIQIHDGGESMLTDMSSAKICEEKCHGTVSSFYAMVPHVVTAADQFEDASRSDAETELKDVDMLSKSSQISGAKSLGSSYFAIVPSGTPGKDTKDIVGKIMNPSLTDKKLTFSSCFAMIPEHPADVSPQNKYESAANSFPPRYITQSNEIARRGTSEEELYSMHCNPSYEQGEHSLHDELCSMHSVLTVPSTHLKAALASRPSNKSLHNRKEADILYAEEKKHQPSTSQATPTPLFVDVSGGNSMTDRDTCEFLNQFSSIFIDNLKDPIPKDPLIASNRDRTSQQQTLLQEQRNKEQLLKPRKSEPINTVALAESISQIGSSHFKTVPSVTSKKSDTTGLVQKSRSVTNSPIPSVHLTKSETSRPKPGRVTEDIRSVEEGCAPLDTLSIASKNNDIPSGVSQNFRERESTEVACEMLTQPVSQYSGILKTTSKPSLGRIRETAAPACNVLEVTPNAGKLQTLRTPTPSVEKIHNTEVTCDALGSYPSLYNAKKKLDVEQKPVREVEPSKELGCDLFTDLTTKQASVHKSLRDTDRSAEIGCDQPINLTPNVKQYETKEPKSDRRDISPATSERIEQMHDYTNRERVRRPSTKEPLSSEMPSDSVPIAETADIVPQKDYSSRVLSKPSSTRYTTSPVDERSSATKPTVKEPPQRVECYQLGRPPPTPFTEVADVHTVNPVRASRKSAVSFQAPAQHAISGENSRGYGSGYQNLASPSQSANAAMSPVPASSTTASSTSATDRGATLRWKIIIKHHRENVEDQPPSKRSKGLPMLSDGQVEENATRGARASRRGSREKSPGQERPRSPNEKP